MKFSLLRNLTVVIFVFVQSISFAQDFKAGLIAGINTSQVSGDNLNGFNKPSPIVGGFVERFFSTDFSIQMEISYLGKGSRKNIDTTRNDFSLYRLNMHYAEVPLMFKFHFTPKLKFEAGPSFGYLISFREADEFGDLVGQYSPKEEFKRLDLSLAGGMYYAITEKFFFNLRLTNSLLPIRDHDGNTKFRLNRGQYHTGLAFRLQYQL